MDYDNLKYGAGRRYRSSRSMRLCVVLVFLAACAPLHQVHAASGLLPEICASMSSASGASLTLATAGATHSFTITARDYSGIPVSLESGSTFVMRLGDQIARASVQQTPGGATHVGSYDVAASGVDRLSLLLAKCE
jgi:hypothetical protein